MTYRRLDQDASSLRAAIMVAVVAFCGCTDVRHKLVSMMTPEYEPETTAATPSVPQSVGLAAVVSHVTEPTDIQFAPGRPQGMFLTQKGGGLYWFDLQRDTRRLLATFPVLTASEQGLLGLALHPQFAENGRAFVNLSRSGGEGDESAVVEITMSLDDQGRPVSAQVVRDIYRVAQPYPNHNAGQLAFGPDGYLYIGWGDGGWRGDPHDHGQNLATALGAMLRIDVSASSDTQPYAVPSDNPFIDTAGALPEIWAYGLRNPWRYSFAPDGRLLVADVGQNAWEEVDIVERGKNYGWKVREGRHCYAPKEDCPEAGLVDPIWEYDRDQGKSITGGYVYPGTAIAGLQGLYVVGDFVSGRLWALELPAATTAPAQAHELGRWSKLFSTFGSNGQDVFVADFGAGVVYKLTAATESGG